MKDTQLFTILFTLLGLAVVFSPAQGADGDYKDHDERRDYNRDHDDDDPDHDDGDYADEEAYARAEIAEYLRENPEAKDLKAFVDTKLGQTIWPTLIELVEREPFEAKEVYRHLDEIRGEYRDMQEWRPDMAEVFLTYHKFDIASRITGREIEELKTSGGSPSQIEEQKNALRTQLERAFAARLTMQRAELEVLEDEVTELRQLLEQRESKRDEIIERRFRELTGADAYLEW